jgi:hypothetical protein
MADTAVAITAGSGTNVDTRTESTNGNHRQVIVIGDPATNAGVAPVDATKGLAVDLTASGALPTVTNLATIAGTAPAFGDGAKGATVLRTTLATDSAGIIATGTAGSASSQVLTVQGVAAMTPVASVGKSAVVSVTLSTDTSAYASGDLIADTQQIDAFFRVADGTGVINSINIIDEDAQGVALYIIFMSTSTSLGTENSAPNISDANLTAGFQGIVAVATTDYVTISGTKVATIKNIGLPVKAASGTDDLYIAVLNATGTPTFTASGLEMRIGVLLD